MFDEAFLRDYLADLCTGELAHVVDCWLAAAVTDWEKETPARRSHYIQQATRFLPLLAEGARRVAGVSCSLTPDIEQALRADFPLLYTEAMLHPLAALLADRFQQQYDASDITATTFTHTITQGLAASPILLPAPVSLEERLNRLNQFALRLSGCRDHDTIIDNTLVEAPKLVDAESCMLWPWDADQQAPTMMVTHEMRTMSFPFSTSLLALFRQASQEGRTFTIAPTEYAESWPPELVPQPVVLIPLFSQQGCLGILTVHHHQHGRFTEESLLLLSALGNLVATALFNAQLYARERHPVNLLQTSIRQVVQATSRGLDQYEEFVQSLLQVGEGLTRAEAVCAYVEVEEQPAPITGASGALLGVFQTDLATLTGDLPRRLRKYALPPTGVLRDILPADVSIAKHLLAYHYAIVEIPFGDKTSFGEKATGIVYALNTGAFTDDQLAFLRTIAEQVGVGINNMQQTANVASLLIEMSNVSYVAEKIVSTFDPQKILSIINQGASQALKVPIVFCVWLEEDGTLRIMPETAVGLPEKIERQINLTYNHSIIRQVLKTKKPITSRSMMAQARPPFPKLAELGMQDWACLPMIVQADVRGIMLAADSKPREFSAREIALFLTYANQAALALNNSLLYEQAVERQSQQMAALINFAKVVSSTQDLAVVHEELLHTATTEMQAPAAILTRMKANSNIQQVVGTTGITPFSLADVEFALDEGILGVAAQWKMPIDSLNLPGDGRSATLREFAREQGLASSLTVPLIEHDQVLGTLTVFSREAREFTAAQQHLLQAVAIAGALAIRAITLVDPEVASHHITRDLVHHTVTTLSFVTDLLDITKRTEPGSFGIMRMRQRMEVMAAVQEEIVTTHPTTADVKGAMLRLRECWFDLAGDQHPTIRIEGSRVVLPDRKALALAMLIHEWVACRLERLPRRAECTLVLTFQQSYRDIWFHLDCEGDCQHETPTINTAIFDLANHLLEGTLEETAGQAKQSIRYHFTVPDAQ